LWGSGELGFYGGDVSANQVTTDSRVESLRTDVAEDGLWLRKLSEIILLLSLIRISVEAILYVTIPKTLLFLFFISDSFLMACKTKAYTQQSSQLPTLFSDDSNPSDQCMRMIVE
jgi:hypothetical protein